ncbi:ATP-binding protein [Haloparvum sp. PAK95]|uniref:sensor histidine kinase n=1 Tax=Haloparvum sp. PAK95 TaxID=3418962 RepID=UPI003D2EE2A4
MKIRHRLVIALCLVGLVLGATTFAGFELFEDRTVSQMEANVEETAGLSADVVAGRIREQKERVAYLAARPPARGDEVRSYLRSFVRNSEFTSAHVVAANGTVTTAYAESGVPGTPAVGANHANRTYVQRSLAGGTYMSPVTCLDGGSCRVRISAPVFAAGDDPGEVTSVLAATIPVGSGAFFSPTALTRETTAVYVVAPTDGGADSFTFGESRGSFDSSVTGSAPVASTGWVVRVERNRAALDRTLRRAFYAQVLSLLIVLLSIATFGAWEYRTNLGQIERLLDGFSALRRGDYDHSLDLSAAEEWREIDRQFDRLATTLAEREAAVEEQKRRRGMLHRLLRHNLRNDINVILGQAELVPEHSGDEDVRRIARSIRDTSRGLIEQADKARKLEQLMAEAAEAEVVDLVDIVEEKTSAVTDSYDNVQVSTELPDEAKVLASPLLPYAVEELLENAVEHNQSDPVVIDASVEQVAAPTTGSDAESTGESPADPPARSTGESATDSATEPAVDSATDGPVAGDVDPSHVDDEEIVRFRLSDNGPGIPAQDRRVLTGAEETSLEHGSGIGLRFVYWTVQQVSGSVEVSTGKDGTTIDLLIPALSTESAESEEAGADDEQQGTAE